MGYLPFAALPAAVPPPGATGGARGFAVAPEPRELIGFAASDPADTRRQLTALVAALRTAERHATELLDDFPASHHGDYAEMLATLTGLDTTDPDDAATTTTPGAPGSAAGAPAPAAAAAGTAASDPDPAAAAAPDPAAAGAAAGTCSPAAAPAAASSSAAPAAAGAPAPAAATGSAATGSAAAGAAGAAAGTAAPDPAAAGVALLGLERAVVDFCTDLALGDRRRTHGYVTAGGAEALLVGLRAGRDALPGAPLYVSAAAHHAARCHARRLGMDVVEVPPDEDGAMDSRALRLLTAERPGGAVVLATVAGAAEDGDDDLPAIRAAAGAAGPVHVHVDTTHAGLLAPFSPHPVAWDLRDGADSLSLSANRLLGLPVPCGVVLVGAARSRPARSHGCTPNPLGVALLWAALRDRGYDGLRALVHECHDTARYAADRLTAAGHRATRTGHGLTVRFPRPAPAVCTRWHLTAEGPHATLSVLPPLTRATVDALCRDLAPSRRDA